MKGTLCWARLTPFYSTGNSICLTPSSSRANELFLRLTRGRLHATDYSNICATGLFDPYILEYAEWLMRLLQIPKTMLPEIKDTCGDWGSIHSAIFGAEIPIHCVV